MSFLVNLIGLCWIKKKIFLIIDLPQTWMVVCQHFHKAHLKTVFNIVHISWAANQYIRMISEGSHDTKDWSKNSALNHGNKLHFKINSHRKQFFFLLYF